ncbi:hypothetical protein L842_4351 [Mycobacterium intracellulare MIN_052511_1280]|nr:hypothetical protein L842_4351 [Mycobacterium intracellulare MIN_052511_1280]
MLADAAVQPEAPRTMATPATPTKSFGIILALWSSHQFRMFQL